MRAFERGLRRVAVVLVVIVAAGVLGQPASATGFAPRAVESAFVTRSGNLLVLGGTVFRFAGANEYYLGLDDNVRDAAGNPTYPTHTIIADALQSAVRTGATVIRAQTLGISVGCPVCFEPTNGVFNPRALDSADYALALAGRLGLKVIIPLTDQWRFYHGGESTFIGWHGYPNDPNPAVNASNSTAQRQSEAHFYSDNAVVQDFKWYISNLLEHVNPYNGIPYKNDPTVLAWETGNEIWTATPAWTSDIAQYIKQYLGARQLVADGSAASGMSVSNAAIDSPWIDIVGGHFYPVDLNWMHADAIVAAAHQKAYVVGEFDWRVASATSALVQDVQADRNISGDLYWVLMPHLPDGTPEPNPAGYAMWSPAVRPSAASILSTLVAHAGWMATAH